ncbi:hypothetical protein ASZ90_010741 [hydrocarbon metagenome]|uniref:Uncharacterized protein n=1 Tax=hydrocarbon metagenome TaxID=938273 RepID=A0A0W8FF78_9ZZZZ
MDRGAENQVTGFAYFRNRFAFHRNRQMPASGKGIGNPVFIRFFPRSTTAGEAHVPDLRR